MKKTILLFVPLSLFSEVVTQQSAQPQPQLQSKYSQQASYNTTGIVNLSGVPSTGQVAGTTVDAAHSAAPMMTGQLQMNNGQVYPSGQGLAVSQPGISSPQAVIPSIPPQVKQALEAEGIQTGDLIGVTEDGKKVYSARHKNKKNKASSKRRK